MSISADQGGSQTQFAVALADIRRAAERLKGDITATNLIRSRVFSEECGNEVYLKPENLQVTGSFKIRGAYNRIVQLSEAEKQRGLVTSSAGNHAQGVAYAAQKLNAKAVIVMPKATPLIKVDATRSYGAEVVLAGNYYDEAYAEARRLERERGLVFVHPFNDWEVIAGQGTIGLEILAELPTADAILVPVGGGGLISGIAIAAKAINPAVRIIGVEPTGANAMQLSMTNKRLTSSDIVSTIADGVAVKTPGENPFSVVRELVDEIITVTDYDLMESFLVLLEKHKLLAENAGVLPLAALKKIPGTGQKLVCVISGGNIDVLTIASLVNHGLVSRNRIFCFAVELPDIPGELNKISRVLAEQYANVIQLDYDQFKALDRFRKVVLEITVETNGSEHMRQITQALEQAGYSLKRVY